MNSITHPDFFSMLFINQENEHFIVSNNNEIYAEDFLKAAISDTDPNRKYLYFFSIDKNQSFFNKDIYSNGVINLKEKTIKQPDSYFASTALNISIVANEKLRNQPNVFPISALFE